MQAGLYEELDKRNLEVMACKKESLKRILCQLNGGLNLNSDSLIIQVCENQYKIYYSGKKDVFENSAYIQLDLAIRFRMELDINDME